MTTAPPIAKKKMTTAKTYLTVHLSFKFTTSQALICSRLYSTEAAVHNSKKKTAAASSVQNMWLWPIAAMPCISYEQL